ncbi:MAG: hypothetical protein IAE63_06850 [Alphaproteobacteria bacterium]|nr:hypothetical protein [Alphaproteobacteria bacterium]
MSNALNQFLDLQEMDITSFSAALGVPYQTAWRIVRGKVIPSDPLKIKIYRITMGKITPNDFYDLPDLSSPSGDLQADFLSSVSSPKVFPESCQDSVGGGC